MKKTEQPLHDYPGQISGGAEVRVGDPLPMGTHENGAGVNFAFFSRHASRVWLQLFERPADATPFRVIALDPAINRTGDVRYVWVEGIRPGQLYAYRVEKRFGCLIHEDEQSALFLMFNAGVDAFDFDLPSASPGSRWHLAVDTSREAPQDLFTAGEEPLCEPSQAYHLSPRSSAILLARKTSHQKSETPATEAKGPIPLVSSDLQE